MKDSPVSRRQFMQVSTAGIATAPLSVSLEEIKDLLRKHGAIIPSKG